MSAEGNEGQDTEDGKFKPNTNEYSHLTASSEESVNKERNHVKDEETARLLALKMDGDIDQAQVLEQAGGAFTEQASANAEMLRERAKAVSEADFPKDPIQREQVRGQLQADKDERDTLNAHQTLRQKLDYYTYGVTVDGPGSQYLASTKEAQRETQRLKAKALRKAKGSSRARELFDRLRGKS
jgi:hypothetical protein